MVTLNMPLYQQKIIRWILLVYAWVRRRQHRRSVQRVSHYPSRTKGITARVLKFAGYVHHY